MIETSEWKSFDGTTLFCRKTGRGKPLILIHGACVDGNCFGKLPELLSEHYTVYWYDRAGCGRSEKHKGGNSLENHAEDLLHLLRNIGPEVSVIGHSGGCLPVLKLLEDHPESIRKVLLFEPVLLYEFIFDPERKAVLDQIYEMVSGTKDVFCMFEMFSVYFGNEEENPRKITNEEYRSVWRNTKTFFLQDYCAFLDYRIGKEIPAEKIRIGYGSKSTDSYRYDESKRIADHFQCGTICFHGAHNAPMDHPEDFVKTLQAEKW